MKVVIIEDENLASGQMESLIKEVEPSAQVVAKLASVASSVKWLESNEHPDLFLADIQLLDGLSFEIFERVKITRPVIFTTAYDQYAIRAFQVNSIDYLLKPVQKDRLRASLEKYRSVMSQPAVPNYAEVLRFLKAPQPEYKSRFMIRVGQKIAAIPAEKIAYFYSESKLTYIVTRDSKRYPYDQTLEEVIELLDPRSFFRVNRQYIITFDAIAEMHPYFKGRLKLALNPPTSDEVIISAERTPEFKKWIDQ
ncbi:MAG TPA: LytTR family DNA-binding domain-containing protein [Ohtaekwangia sp.]|nr:LytTR family DNA-binding domain-containing protein [Ohtaekwangia sp.]